MSTELSYFATAPRLLEGLLAEELRALGAGAVRERRAGVSFSGNLETGYRCCLWSRLANRILLQLGEFECGDAEMLYHGVQGVDWSEHIASTGTLTVDANGTSEALRNTQFVAQKVKDAIVDQIRAASEARPSVARERPDVRVSLHLHRGRASVALDLAGESLHRRGYRQAGITAPLKENLAAAILLRAGWPALVAEGAPLLDPMCGSGTLPIEAALIAGDIAPGLWRDYYGFLGWLGHVPATWRRLLVEARERRAAGLSRIPRILGFDRDRHAIHAARGNLERVGLNGPVHIERRELADLEAFRGLPAEGRGMLVCNPPYGERLGQREGVGALYAELGEVMKRRFQGWRAGIIIADAELGFRLGLRAERTTRFYNGTLECTLLNLRVNPDQYLKPRRRLGTGEQLRGGPRTEGGAMFANRLRKNLRTSRRWANRAGVTCYRLYDADMPEYALAVDLYQGDETWAHVQEYAAPPSVAADSAETRRNEALAVIAEVLGLSASHLFLKVRRRQKGNSQYQKLDSRGTEIEVREGPCRLLINLGDYLDTGLFLDHRPLREMIGKMAAGKRFLNLFCYTGAATVHAAVGGADATVSVDMSRAYLDWAGRNLACNGIDTGGGHHQLLQEDCLRWLQVQVDRSGPGFGLILLDPPSFSNSKRMRENLDIQRDHVRLIRNCTQLLTAGGVLIFSTNQRRFQLDEAALTDLNIDDISRKTIPRDYARNPRIHRCWLIRRSA